MLRSLSSPSRKLLQRCHLRTLSSTAADAAIAPPTSHTATKHSPHTATPPSLIAAHPYFFMPPIPDYTPLPIIPATFSTPNNTVFVGGNLPPPLNTLMQSLFENSVKFYWTQFLNISDQLAMKIIDSKLTGAYYLTCKMMGEIVSSVETKEAQMTFKAVQAEVETLVEEMDKLDEAAKDALIDSGEWVPPARVKEVDRIRLDAKMPESLYNKLNTQAQLGADVGERYFDADLCEAVKSHVAKAFFPLIFEEKGVSSSTSSSKAASSDGIVDRSLRKKLHKTMELWRAANGPDVSIEHELHDVVSCEVVKSELILNLVRDDCRVTLPDPPSTPDAVDLEVSFSETDLTAAMHTMLDESDLKSAIDFEKECRIWGVMPNDDEVFIVKHPKDNKPGCIGFFDESVRIYLKADEEDDDDAEYFDVNDVNRTDFKPNVGEDFGGEQMRFGGETFTARVWVKVVCDETFGYSWKGAESGKNVVRMDAGHTLLLEATLRRDTAEKRKRVMLEDFEWRVADVDLCAGGNYYA